MSTISYDSEKMEEVATGYKNSLKAVQPIKTAMLKDVKTIRENWEGDDALLAAPDLKAIEDQITNVEANLTEIVSLVGKVMGDFGQIKYREEGDNNG